VIEGRDKVKKSSRRQWRDRDKIEKGEKPRRRKQLDAAKIDDKPQRKCMSECF
jgi:hypothetical protein